MPFGDPIMQGSTTPSLWPNTGPQLIWNRTAQQWASAWSSICTRGGCTRKNIPLLPLPVCGAKKVGDRCLNVHLLTSLGPGILTTGIALDWYFNDSFNGDGIKRIKICQKQQHQHIVNPDSATCTSTAICNCLYFFFLFLPDGWWNDD